MSQTHAQAGDRADLVLYDGVCGLCNGVVRFVLRHDRRNRFRFASLQSPTAATTLNRFGRSADELSTFYVLPDYPGASTVLSKSRAALFLLTSLGWPWKAAGALVLVPESVADRLYDVMVRHRYRLFGRSDQCMLPRPEERDRFLDV